MNMIIVLIVVYISSMSELGYIIIVFVNFLIIKLLNHTIKIRERDHGDESEKEGEFF